MAVLPEIDNDGSVIVSKRFGNVGDLPSLGDSSSTGG